MGETLLPNSENVVQTKYKGGALAFTTNEGVTLNEVDKIFSKDTGLGVQVLTDSEEMASQIDAVSGKSLPPCCTLIYLTKKDTGVTTPFARRAKRIGPGTSGEMSVSEDLKTYAIAGPEKFGSLISLVYGIRSFALADQGIVGLHAAALYDKDRDRVHLIIGKSGIGKSTYAHLLEQNSPRFEVLSDDWVEIVHENLNVIPISNVSSARDQSDLGIYLASSTKYRILFDSFGKRFYSYSPSKDYELKAVGKIIQIHNGNYTSIEDLYRRSHVNIPFMNEALFRSGEASNFTNQAAESRVQALIRGFLYISQQENFQLIHARQGDISSVLNQIEEQF